MDLEQRRGGQGGALKAGYKGGSQGGELKGTGRLENMDLR